MKEICPCCGMEIRTWKKSIISTAVASLCRLVRKYEGKALHHDEFTVLQKDRNFSQLVHWGLIRPASHEDSTKRSSGKWHPTSRGVAFVHGYQSVPKYIVTRNNEFLRYEGEQVNVQTALRNRFNYQELLNLN